MLALSLLGVGKPGTLGLILVRQASEKASFEAEVHLSIMFATH